MEFSRDNIPNSIYKNKNLMQLHLIAFSLDNIPNNYMLLCDAFDKSSHDNTVNLISIKILCSAFQRVLPRQQPQFYLHKLLVQCIWWSSFLMTTFRIWSLNAVHLIDLPFDRLAFWFLPFGFEGRMWDLIVSVPDHCLSFYFAIATFSIWFTSNAYIVHFMKFSRDNIPNLIFMQCIW